MLYIQSYINTFKNEQNFLWLIKPCHNFKLMGKKVKEANIY